MAKAESSATAAKNGIKANVNVNGAGDGPTYDLPWYAISSSFSSSSSYTYNYAYTYHPMYSTPAYSKSGLKNTDQCTWTI